VQSAPPPALSVIVPAFNEEAGIGHCLAELRQHLSGLRVTWEIVVVDDGSRDRTVEVAARHAGDEPRIRLILGERLGKGGAIRRGILAARGTWRFMADADLAMPLDNLERFLHAVSGPAVPHIVIGSREAPGGQRLDEHRFRFAIGRLFNWWVRMLVLPGVADTQCGFKLFSASAAEALFPRLTTDGFAFDVELLALARRAGYQIREVGIVWRGRGDSRVAVARGAAAFGDVARIAWNGWLGRYGPVVSQALVTPARPIDTLTTRSA
jgi:dolichyl-phosphate beta-glucosyltransferase